MIKKILLSVLLISSLSVKAQMITNVDSLVQHRSTSFSHSEVGNRKVHIHVRDLRVDKALKLLEKKANVQFVFDGIVIRKKIHYTLAPMPKLDDYLQFIFHCTDVRWRYQKSAVVFYAVPVESGCTERSDGIRNFSH